MPRTSAKGEGIKPVRQKSAPEMTMTLFRMEILSSLLRSAEKIVQVFVTGPCIQQQNFLGVFNLTHGQDFL